MCREADPAKPEIGATFDKDGDGTSEYWPGEANLGFH